MAIAVLHQQSFLILRCSSSLHTTYYVQLLTLYIWDQLLQVNNTNTTTATVLSTVLFYCSNTTATVPSSRLPQSLISPIYQMPAQNLDQQLVCPLHGRFVLWNMKPKKYTKGDHTLSETRHLKSWLVGIWQSALPGSWFHIWALGMRGTVAIWFQTVGLRDYKRFSILPFACFSLCEGFEGIQKVAHPIS